MIQSEMMTAGNIEEVREGVWVKDEMKARDKVREKSKWGSQSVIYVVFLASLTKCISNDFVVDVLEMH